jgi:hypothetical protein
LFPFGTNILRIFSLLTLLLILSPLIGHAQFETGSVLGTVHDVSGSVVSRATVTATNVATGVTVTRQTNSDGDYEVPALRAGKYNVEIVREGYAPSRVEGVQVNIAARQRVDLVLTVGSLATTVNVTASAPLVETDTSQRGQIVTSYQTSSLPLVSRNYSDLLALSTGVRLAPSGMTTSATTGLVREGSYNVNGQRSMFNNFMLDGMDNNAYGTSNQGFSNQIFNPPPDSISQFQVVTNNQSAEYGRASGATFNVAYRTGTDQLHGLVYEFARNTVLNAIGYFHTPHPIKPKFIRNQFGGNLGGPIMRDRLFFFTDYEGFREVRSQNTTASLPTENQRNRIFATTVYDPYTGTAYAANTHIPENAPNISPTALRVLSLLPQNTTTGASQNYTTLQASRNYSDKGSARLDFQASPRDSFFVRISDVKQNALDAPLFPEPLDGSTNGTQRIHSEQVAVGWTRTISSNQLLEARVGLSSTRAGKYSRSIGDTSFSFPGLPTNPVVAGGLPTTSISGFSTLGRQSTNPQWQNPSLLDPKVNYTWVKGKHSIKAGYEFERVWIGVQDNPPLYGTWTFGGGFTRQYKNGQAVGSASNDNYVADYLFSAPSAYSISTFNVVHLRNNQHSGYVQDDWKVSRQLTLNVGLRYEYGSPYVERDNLQTNFDPTTRTMIAATNGNRGLLQPDRNDFAPRFGFAFAPDLKTSIRGGYGTSYSRYDRVGSANILAFNAPQALILSVLQTPTRAGGTAGFRTMEDGFPSLTFNPLTSNITYINSNKYRDSYVHSYYLAVQRQIAENALFDLAYVGNAGMKLMQIANYNQRKIVDGVLVRPIPTYGDITISQRTANSHYDSVQARFEIRNVAGFTLLNSFTYSHALDSAGASLESSTPSPQDYYNPAADYGTSDYDQPLINTTSIVYELPFGRGKHHLATEGFLNQVVGGWQIAAVNQSQSGVPFNITYSPTSTNLVSGIAASYRGANLYRPNRVPGVALSKLDKSRATGTTALPYLNLDAITLPPSGTANDVKSPFGNMARNAGRAPSINTLNLTMNKRFDIVGDRVKFEFRGEFYNILNHSNFTAPGGISYSINTTTATTPTSGGAITSTFDPRIIQLGGKLSF